MTDRTTRLFAPLLAGASLPDRLFACLGACIGIALTGLISAWLLGPAAIFLVAPLGASAVLVFAVPASPLAQPWPLVGGNSISALVGILVARWVPDPSLGGALAVALAILVMSLLRCLHPPGGAAALTAVIGGPAVHAAGFGFALAPVALNSLLLLAAGLAFHRFSRHSYPHRPAPASSVPDAALLREDIDRALAESGDAFDISREDLDSLLLHAEQHAARRRANRAF